MNGKNYISGRQKEQGVIITLVAVFMLAVIGAMAALSIDVVTLYTARSEAQLAADAGALAGARALANSGMTSATTPSISSFETIARTVATQVAANNQVGGSYLNGNAAACTPGNASGQQICVSFNDTALTFGWDPQITVTVQRSDLPTFFARLLGSTQLKVTAVAKAEAYNPSWSTDTVKTPVAPICVKPWLLPNIDPSNPPNPIFSIATGTPASTTIGLVGWPPSTGGTGMRADCATCTASSGPTVWRYYPGTTDSTGGLPPSFPPPSAASVTCSGCSGFSNYQLSIAGCVQTPIHCNQIVQIDQNSDPYRNLHTAEAVDSLAHSGNNGGDSVNTALLTPPFMFVAGSDNPVVQGSITMVSDSLVTVPVIDESSLPTSFPSAQIIGFVQLFLQPNGQKVNPGTHRIETQVINLIGCGTTPMEPQPILGDGASPVAVRLISLN
jgi:Flp pilus assembly protein TadG